MSEIEQVQRALNAPVTGELDGLTFRTIALYQARNKLKVTGRINNDLRRSLRIEEEVSAPETFEPAGPSPADEEVDEEA